MLDSGAVPAGPVPSPCCTKSVSVEIAKCQNYQKYPVLSQLNAVVRCHVVTGRVVESPKCDQCVCWLGELQRSLRPSSRYRGGVILLTEKEGRERNTEEREGGGIGIGREGGKPRAAFLFLLRD